LFPGSVIFKKDEESKLSIDAFDVLQNTIGDCWLMSVLASVCSTDIIENMIVCSNPVEGFTVFRVLDCQVCVDHMVPVLLKFDGTREILAPKISGCNEYWPILIEKLFVKLFSNYNICPYEIYQFNLCRRISKGIWHTGPDYSDINGGFPRWGLSILLQTQLEPIHTKFIPDIVSALDCDEGEYLVACACTSLEKSDSYTDQGFVYGHAYSILWVDKGKNLIRVRNPWGETESTKYDDDGVLNGPNWKNDGEFFVDVADFKERFPIVTFAKIRKTRVCVKP
tara:strand:- start:4254 stop:5096 length:843 start_codon:yes stop_codon:yes gene_type:complete